MVINVSAQYNGGFSPEIILLTLRDYIGEPFYRAEFFVLTANVLIPPKKPFDYSGGLAAVRFFLTLQNTRIFREDS